MRTSALFGAKNFAFFEEESSQMFKTKYFQIYNVFSKKRSSL